MASLPILDWIAYPKSAQSPPFGNLSKATFPYKEAPGTGLWHTEILFTVWPKILQTHSRWKVREERTGSESLNCTAIAYWNFRNIGRCLVPSPFQGIRLALMGFDWSLSFFDFFCSLGFVLCCVVCVLLFFWNGWCVGWLAGMKSERQFHVVVHLHEYAHLWFHRVRKFKAGIPRCCSPSWLGKWP